jgi:hypothetical protein
MKCRRLPTAFVAAMLGEFYTPPPQIMRRKPKPDEPTPLEIKQVDERLAAEGVYATGETIRTSWAWLNPK